MIQRVQQQCRQLFEKPSLTHWLGGLLASSPSGRGDIPSWRCLGGLSFLLVLEDMAVFRTVQRFQCLNTYPPTSDF